MASQFFAPSGDNRDKLHQERDQLIDEIERLEEERRKLIGRQNQLSDYISALERKLGYRRTVKILDAKKESWSWAAGRIERNQKLSALLDRPKKSKKRAKKKK